MPGATAAIISGIIAAGSAVARTAAQSSEMAQAQSESDLISRIMRDLAHRDKLKENTMRMGQYRTAKEFQEIQDKKMQDEIKRNERTKGYQTTRAEMQDFLNTVNNNVALKRSLVNDIVSKRRGMI